MSQLTDDLAKIQFKRHATVTATMKFNGIDIKLNEILSKGDKTIMTVISGSGLVVAKHLNKYLMIFSIELYFYSSNIK